MLARSMLVSLAIALLLPAMANAQARPAYVTSPNIAVPIAPTPPPAAGEFVINGTSSYDAGRQAGSTTDNTPSELQFVIESVEIKTLSNGKKVTIFTVLDTDPYNLPATPATGTKTSKNFLST